VAAHLEHGFATLIAERLADGQLTSMASISRLRPCYHLTGRGTLIAPGFAGHRTSRRRPRWEQSCPARR
jgi:hypothetical protein